ncbi:TetR/AcrR family transcriptional regulator [Cupriavidus sp. 8B]
MKDAFSTSSESRMHLLRAAAECFMERGFHATSIDDVARRIRATKGLVYYHFLSKMDLFFEVYRVGMAALTEAVAAARKTEHAGLPAVTAMLEAHALTMFEYHAFEHVVAQGVQLHRFSAMTSVQRMTFDELVASRDRLEQMYRTEVAAAQADGSVSGDTEPSIAVKTILGGIQWSVIWWRPEADQGLEARLVLARQMVRTLIRGLEVRR